MKQPMQEKYTVAWFKLAEFVARGEKERALGLYKLLAHSFEDAALAHQLEGDILNAFNDRQAIDAYRRAIEHYITHNRCIEAAALYEQLDAMAPHTIHTLKALISLYKKLALMAPLIDAYSRLAVAYAEHKNFNELELFIADVRNDVPKEERARIFEHMCVTLVKHKANATIIEWALENAIAELAAHENSVHLFSLITHLQAVDQQWYEYATALI